MINWFTNVVLSNRCLCHLRPEVNAVQFAVFIPPNLLMALQAGVMITVAFNACAIFGVPSRLQPSTTINSKSRDFPRALTQAARLEASFSVGNMTLVLNDVIKRPMMN